MNQKPYYQKLETNPSFPFRFKDNIFTNYAFHWHELLELIYVLEGSISIVIEGNVYHAVKGDIAVINSGAIHGFLNASPDVILSNYQFGAELFDQTLSDMWERTTRRLVFGRKILITATNEGEIHQHIQDVLLSIREEYYAQHDGFRLAIRMRLYELALIFLRDIPSREIPPEEITKHNHNHQMLERIFSFIHDKFRDPHITLDEVAEAAALSKFYFSRYFKQQVGQTFYVYLSRLRINEAEKYLAESDMPIIDIAYRSGFSSLKTFNRVFKQYSGTTPSSYRSGKNDKAGSPS